MVPAAPGARRDRVNWVAHLALILAVATVTASLAGRSDSRLLRVLSLAVMVALVVLFIAQTFRAQRVGGPLGKGTAYALSAAGALCTLLARLASAQSTAIALTIFGALFYVGGLVGFVIQIRQLRGSQ
jgi:hypothetical protein